MNEVTGAFVAVLVVCVILYPLPSIIAMYRGHKNLPAILVVNVFLGCTLLGWTAALAWSIMADQKTAPKRRKRPSGPNPFDEPAVYSCPHCFHTVYVDQNLIGFAVPCWHCGHYFTATR